jgi:hypothetical protein
MTNTSLAQLGSAQGPGRPSLSFVEEALHPRADISYESDH